MGSVDCQACPEGQYGPDYGTANCLPCPMGGLCIKDEAGLYSNFTNKDGWFLFEDKEHHTLDGHKAVKLIRCYHGNDGSACLAGERCHIDPDTGEEAMEGIFCGKCRKGYGRGSPTSVCRKCPSVEASFFLSVLNLLILCLVAQLVYYVILKTDLSKPKNIGAVILKQLLNYLGMTTVVLTVCDFKIPLRLGHFEEVIEVLRVIFATSTADFAVHAGYCFADEIMAPENLYVICGLIWVPLHVLAISSFFFAYRWYAQFKHFDHVIRRDKLLTLLIVHLFLVHPRNTELSLSAFHCVHLDKPRLTVNLEVDCQSDDQNTWQYLGAMGFCLYSFGIPLILWFLLRHYKLTGRLLQASTINTFGFLYSGSSLSTTIWRRCSW